ncbi:MAG: hypothetical protein ACR2QW_06750 [bacterium]
MNTRSLVGIFVSLTALVLSACATIPPDKAAMIPDWDAPEEVISTANLWVIDVTGGAEPHSYSTTASDWSNRLSDDEFKEALVEALRHSKIFTNVDTGAVHENAYKLNAQIISQPEVSPGFDMEVTLWVRYTLTDHTGHEVLAENIFSEYQTKSEETFMGAKRMILTREGVVRNNFSQLLDKLSSVMKLEKG